MKRCFPKIYYLSSYFLLFICTTSLAQIVNFNDKTTYNKVFIKTDNFGASYLNQLESAYYKVTNDTLKFSILNDLAYYWHTRNLTTALNFTNKGLAITKAKKNILWEGKFLITKGAILLRMEKLDSALLVLQNAKLKVKEEDLPFLNTQLGYVFERKGQLDKAADYAIESLKLGEKLNDKKAIALAYSDLSNLFWKQSKFEKGLEYGLISIAHFEERGLNDLDYDFTLYLVGNNYLALKKYGKALNFYEHSLSIGNRYGFYNNLSDVYISLVDLYAFLNKFEKAELAGENAVKYAELLDNNFMLMRSWLSIGKLQYLQGKYISAIASLQKSIKIATAEFGDEFYLSQAYELLGKSFAGNHKYKEAYQAFAEYDRLKNQIFTAESDQRISLLQTEFDVAHKESTIEVQEHKLKQQKAIKTSVLIIACLLFLVLILLYITFQNNRKKNYLLQKQNQEKEFLLKEIHHRVKNNLEIVSSLLALQAAEISDSKIKEAMQESQNRVYSMSMIHQRLYKGKNLASIEMKKYFINLGMHVLESFGANERISLKYTMKKNELDVDTAVPLGLIVNELLTNSLKYAFPKMRKGIITINLKKIKNHTFMLEFSDNGIGLVQNKFKKNIGFGIQLINLLVLQLDGKIEQKVTNGTKYTIMFKAP